MEMTLKIPEELASRLRPLEGELPRILEMGLREFETTRQSGFGGFADVIERLPDLPTPEEVLALRPSAALQARLSALLEKNRTDRFVHRGRARMGGLRISRAYRSAGQSQRCFEAESCLSPL
jgi:hypothetical protein